MPDTDTSSELSQEQTLTERQREILRLLVQEYVSTASPVGSRTIKRTGGVTYSSATIRNELALLEELGYIFQPHTSAGRMPTVQGYRYFVEQLMGQVDLTVAEKRTISHQFHQIRMNLDQWMQLTVAVLAHATRSAALVTPPRAISAAFKHIELISISESMCLMILVLRDSNIHQEMFVTTQPIDQENLSSASNRLNTLLGNQSADQIRATAHPDLIGLSSWERQVLNRIILVMDSADENSFDEVYRDGLANVFRQPEFSDVDKFRQIIEMLEHQSILQTILSGITHANGVQILIGDEMKENDMDDVSLILSPYGIRGMASGVLGVIGPTRMPYARSISTVRFVAQLMNELIADVYGA